MGKYRDKWDKMVITDYREIRLSEACGFIEELLDYYEPEGDGARVAGDQQDRETRSLPESPESTKEKEVKHTKKFLKDGTLLHKIELVEPPQDQAKENEGKDCSNCRYTFHNEYCKDPQVTYCGDWKEKELLGDE